jgi:hypothetical protein
MRPRRSGAERTKRARERRSNDTMRNFPFVIAACLSVAVGVGCALKKDEKKKKTDASTPASADASPGDDSDLGTDFNTDLGTDGTIDSMPMDEELSAPHYAEIPLGGGSGASTVLESVVDEGAWRLACTEQGADLSAIIEVRFNETFPATSGTPGEHVRSIKTGVKCVGTVRLDFDIDKSSTETTLDVTIYDKTGKALKQGKTAAIPFTPNKVAADGTVTTVKVDLPLTDVK